MREIKKIIIHHTASPQKTTTWDLIDAAHKKNGWSGIGYHYLILWSGLITVGRPEAKVGAHVKGKNSDSIGICVAGNFEEEQPLPAQLISLETIILDLFEKYPDAELSWHREEAVTLCPGKNLLPFLRSLKEKIQK